MALPSLTDTLGIAVPPAFVRKIQPRGDWGSPNDPLDLRVTKAVQNFFIAQGQPPYSFYRVETDEDFGRVALALGSTRQNPTQELDFVAFLPEELQAAGITGKQTNGHTPCPLANRLHYDLAANVDQLQALCKSVMEKGRETGRCNRKMMKELQGRAREEQCLAAVNPSPGCLVPTCATPPPVTPSPSASCSSS